MKNGNNDDGNPPPLPLLYFLFFKLYGHCILRHLSVRTHQERKKGMIGVKLHRDRKVEIHSRMIEELEEYETNTRRVDDLSLSSIHE